MPQRTPGETLPLAGTWEKVSTTPCGARYPARLEFQTRGLYAGTAESPGEFTWWDVGTWEVTGDGHVKVSTANDAVLAYRYEIVGGVVTFIDPDGCQFQYRRA